MYEEVKVEDIEILSPFKKGKSESVHSPSGSYSGSNNPIDRRGRRVDKRKSTKTASHYTVEKTSSDFFNLTQESNIDVNHLVASIHDPHSKIEQKYGVLAT